MKRLGEIGELTATAKGNLPPVFVKELFNNLYLDSIFSLPRNEDDSFLITRLKHLLKKSGLIKLLRNTL